MKINKKLIKELVSCLEKNKLSELEYSEKDTKIKVARNYSSQTNKIQVVETKTGIKSDEKIEGIEIKSPIIRAAYLAPEPGGKSLLNLEKKLKGGYSYDS